MLDISAILKTDLQTNTIPVTYLMHLQQANGETFYFANKGMDFDNNIYEDRDLSIKNLKESVNIKDRTWSINAASITMSNVPVNTKRFTNLLDWQGGNDILNCTVKIYIHTTNCNSLGDCLLIYTGRVTDCKTNQDRVVIKTEDSFDEYIKHRHVPFAKLSDSFDVPEEYRNTPIPAVFGSVKKSPLVLQKHPQTQTILMFLPDDIFNGDITIGGISNLQTSLGKITAEIPQYSSWNFELIMEQDQDGNTVNPETFPEWNQSFFDGKIQWIVEGQHIQIKKLFRVQVGQGIAEILSEPENLPAHDKLQLKLNRKPTAYDLPNWQILSEYESVGQLRFLGDTYTLLPTGENSFQLPAPLDDEQYTGRHFNMKFRGMYDCTTAGSTFGNDAQLDITGTKTFMDSVINGNFIKTSFIPIPWGGNYKNKNISTNWQGWMKNIVFWMLKGYYSSNRQLSFIQPQESGFTDFQSFDYDFIQGLDPEIQGTPTDGALWQLSNNIVDNNAYEFIYKESAYLDNCNHEAVAKAGLANRLFRQEFDSYSNYSYNDEINPARAMKNLDGIVIPTNFGSLNTPYFNEYGSYFPDSTYDTRFATQTNGFKNHRYFTWWKPDEDQDQEHCNVNVGGYDIKGYLQRDYIQNHGVTNGLQSLICGLQTGTDVWEDQYENLLKKHTLLPIIQKDVGFDIQFSTVQNEHPSFVDPDGNGYCSSYQTNSDVWVSRGLVQPMIEMFPSDDPQGLRFNNPSMYKCGDFLTGNNLNNEYTEQDFFSTDFTTPTSDALANPFAEEVYEIMPMVEMGLGWGPTPVGHNRVHTHRDSWYDWGFGNPGYNHYGFWINRLQSIIYGRADTQIQEVDEAWQRFGWPTPAAGDGPLGWQDSDEHQGYLHGDGYGDLTYDGTRSYAIARPEYQGIIMYTQGTKELLTFDEAQLYALDQGGGSRARGLIRINFTFDNIDTSNLLPNSVHTYVKAKAFTSFNYNYNTGNGMPFSILTYFTGDELGVANVIGSTGNIASDQTGTFELGDNAGNFDFDETDNKLLKHFDPNWKTPNSRSEFTLDYTFSPIENGDDAEIFITSHISDIELEQTVLIEKISGNRYFADTIGRTDQNSPGSGLGFFTGESLQNFPYDYVITKPCDVLFNLMFVDIGYGDVYNNLVDQEELTIARQNHGSLNFNFTLYKETPVKKLLDEISRQSKLIPRWKSSSNKLGFINFLSTYDYENTYKINYRDVINHKYSRTKLDDVILKCRVLYDFNYNTEKLDKATNEPKQGAVPNNVEDYISFYNIKNIDNHYLELKAPYINSETSAIQLRNFIIEQYKNVHLQIDVTLPVKYLDLECGDTVAFDEIIGFDDTHPDLDFEPNKPFDFKPFGINYTINQFINGQKILPVFMVTSINKSVDKVDLKLWQIHEMDSNMVTQGDEALVIPDLAENTNIDTSTLTLGDVNMDGYVDVRDIVLVVNAILNDEDIGTVEYLPEGP